MGIYDVSGSDTQVRKQMKVLPDSVSILPLNFCLKNSVVILGQVQMTDKSPIHLGMHNVHNLDLIEAISRKFNRKIIPVSLSMAEIAMFLKEGFGTKASHVSTDESGIQVAQVTEANVIKVVNDLLSSAVIRKASDIHIESYRESVAMRYRIDSVLYEIPCPLNKENFLQIVSRIKVLANLDIAEKRLPQSGRIDLKVKAANMEKLITFRVSICPGPFGEDIVLRVLDRSSSILGLDKIGFFGRTLAGFQQLIHNPEGFIIVTGPTGSGKTTTLYSALYEITSPYKKILSAEDPIEYSLDGVNQKQVSKQVSFAMLAREFLRQDPDVILIGEIRDEETANIAIQASQTGHLVFSTLHTQDAVRTIPRLRSLGVQPNTLASSLLGVVSQRLIRKICTNCLIEYTPEPKEIEIVPEAYYPDRWLKGRGCMQCKSLGYLGQTGIYELFLIDDEVEELINRDATILEIRNKAIESGMDTILEDAFMKVKHNITSVEEVFSTLTYRQILSQLEDLKLTKGKLAQLARGATAR
jgi:type II secretory ATPase GspE/PulE/Tfp pilus assembly ATPase PilB-like protein